MDRQRRRCGHGGRYYGAAGGSLFIAEILFGTQCWLPRPVVVSAVVAPS